MHNFTRVILVSTCNSQNYHSIFWENRNLAFDRMLPSRWFTGLSSCVWPGRAQEIHRGDITYYLDGAHTKESIEVCFFSVLFSKYKLFSLNDGSFYFKKFLDFWLFLDWWSFHYAITQKKIMPSLKRIIRHHSKEDYAIIQKNNMPSLRRRLCHH